MRNICVMQWSHWELFLMFQLNCNIYQCEPIKVSGTLSVEAAIELFPRSSAEIKLFLKRRNFLFRGNFLFPSMCVCVWQRWLSGYPRHKSGPCPSFWWLPHPLLEECHTQWCWPDSMSTLPCVTPSAKCMGNESSIPSALPKFHGIPTGLETAPFLTWFNPKLSSVAQWPP